MLQMIETPSTISLKTNESQLYQKLGSIFTDKSKFISELLQNSRRAGATRINISFNETEEIKSLIVEDNGSGISDFQKLLTLAESGWDENVSQVEKPFGIGWFSTLFSAQSVTIESAGKSCHLVSKDVLDMKPVKLTSVQDTGFTRIHLLGVDFTLTSLKKSLLAIVKGFSIPVFLNGEELERPHAIAHLPTTCDIGCGVAYIPGLAKPNSDIDFRSVIYFQGLPVSCPDLGTAWQFAKVNIVHIDNTFSVRMPDRDSFIDPEQTAERIKSALKQAILNTLNNIKATRPVTEFVEYFKALCLVDAQYLLNDVDLLPTEVIETMDHIPDRHNSFQTSFVDEPIHKNKLAGNEQLLIANLDNYHHSEIDNYFALSSLLFWKDALLIKTRDLHKDHWVHGMTKDPKDAKLDVVYEASSSEHFSFRFVCGNLHLVPGFTVNAWGHSYHITNESITLEDGNIICGNDFPSDALLQLDSYETDEVFNEQVHDDDTSSLSHLLFSMRGEKPEVSVQRALQSERIPSMTGCQNTATCVVIAEKKLQVTPLLDILKAFSASLSLPVDEHQMQDFIASLNLAVSQHV